MGQATTFGAATVGERAGAFRMAFPFDETDDRCFRAEELIRRGELAPGAVRVARDGIGLAAALIAAPLPGRGAILWPPRGRPSLHDEPAVFSALCADAIEWLRGRHTTVVQCLLAPEETKQARPLLDNGFQEITRLSYQRHFLDLSFDQLAVHERCRFRVFDQSTESVFLDMLERSNIGSLDCPELNGVRTPAEMLNGFRAAGPFDPERWWLAELDGRAAGVVLATMPEPDAWDVAYLGVVPEARRKGVARELVRKVLFEAKANEIPLVTLAVDVRNQPALGLYRAAGFEAHEERDVYLRLLPRDVE